MAADDVQLPDLEVIQRYSLAVRGETAPRADVIAALQADLDWLKSGTGRTAAKSPGTTTKAAAKSPAKSPAPPKRTARRTPAKRAPAQPTPTSEA
jgi:hypothetical protein